MDLIMNTLYINLTRYREIFHYRQTKGRKPHIHSLCCFIWLVNACKNNSSLCDSKPLFTKPMNFEHPGCFSIKSLDTRRPAHKGLFHKYLLLLYTDWKNWFISSYKVHLRTMLKVKGLVFCSLLPPVVKNTMKNTQGSRDEMIFPMFYLWQETFTALLWFNSLFTPEEGVDLF